MLTIEQLPIAFSRLHGAEIKQVDQAREMVVADLSDEEAVGEVALEFSQRPSQRDRAQPFRQAAHPDQIYRCPGPLPPLGAASCGLAVD